MASVVLDNSQFPSVPNNTLVCDAIKIGGGGIVGNVGDLVVNSLDVKGGVITVETQGEINPLPSGITQLITEPNGFKCGLSVSDAYAGTTLLDSASIVGQPPRGVQFATEIYIPVWSATTNWQNTFASAATGGGNAGFYLVQYGTNTAPPGGVRTDVWMLPATGGLGVVNGVPPGTGLPANGWLQLSALVAANPTVKYPNIQQVLYGLGAAVIGTTLTGSPQAGNQPGQPADSGLQMDFLGGRTIFQRGGMSLRQAGPNSANGAELLLDGSHYFYGLNYLTGEEDAEGPASSAPQFSSVAPFTPVYPTSDGLPFSLGKNYTWQETAPGSGAYNFLVAVGTGGSSVLTLPAIDPSSLVFLQRELDLGTAVGNLVVSAKSNTAFTVSSRDAANAVVATDTAFFVWQIINPHWES